MPALPPVAKTLRVSLKTTDGVALNERTRFYLAYTGPAPTVAQLNTFATAVSTEWATHMLALYNAAIHLVEVDVTDLDSVSGAVGSNTTVVAGTRAGTANPQALAALVNFHIARRYRGGKPRVYLAAGVAADQASTSQWTAAFQSALVTAWNQLIAACVAAPWASATITGQINVSYYAGFTVVTNPVTGRAKNVAKLRVTPVQDTVTAVTVNLVFASQRRRNRP